MATENSDKDISFDEIHATDGCVTEDGGDKISANIEDGSGDYDDEDKCAAACLAKDAWSTTDSIPNSSTATNGGAAGATLDNVTICYGY